MLMFGQHHLQYLIREYTGHYNTERPHQGPDNEINEPPPEGEDEVVCR